MIFKLLNLHNKLNKCSGKKLPLGMERAKGVNGLEKSNIRKKNISRKRLYEIQATGMVTIPVNEL